MLRRPRRHALLAALVLPALAACGSGSNDAAPSSAGAPGSASAPSGTITVYNAQHESLTKEWVTGFTKATGVKVVLRNGDDTEMANQLAAEDKRSPADVFLTENSPAMGIVDAKGLFAEVDPATLQQVPARFRPGTGTWTGIAARSTVFVHNKDKVPANRLPASLMDLAKPEWKGRWGASPSGADFQAIVSAMLQLEGEDATRSWLSAMKSGAKTFQGNTAVLKAVNAGQVDGGVIYHYYYFGDQARTGGQNSDNVASHYFKKQDPGAFVSVSGGGVLKSSKNPAAAQAFLRYLTGKDGQQVLRDGTSFEYPVGAGVAANPKLVPLEQLQAPKVDPASLNSPKVVSLMQEAGLL